MVRAMASLPLRATTAEVQLESHEWEQLLALFALRDASTYSNPAVTRTEEKASSIWLEIFETQDTSKRPRWNKTLTEFRTISIGVLPRPLQKNVPEVRQSGFELKGFLGLFDHVQPFAPAVRRVQLA